MPTVPIENSGHLPKEKERANNPAPGTGNQPKSIEIGQRIVESATPTATRFAYPGKHIVKLEWLG